MMVVWSLKGASLINLTQDCIHVYLSILYYTLCVCLSHLRVMYTEFPLFCFPSSADNDTLIMKCVQKRKEATDTKPPAKQKDTQYHCNQWPASLRVSLQQEDMRKERGRERHYHALCCCMTGNANVLWIRQELKIDDDTPLSLPPIVSFPSDTHNPRFVLPFLPSPSLSLTHFERKRDSCPVKMIPLILREHILEILYLPQPLSLDRSKVLFFTTTLVWEPQKKKKRNHDQAEEEGLKKGIKDRGWRNRRRKEKSEELSTSRVSEWMYFVILHFPFLFRRERERNKETGRQEDSKNECAALLSSVTEKDVSLNAEAGTYITIGGRWTGKDEKRGGWKFSDIHWLDSQKKRRETNEEEDSRTLKYFHWNSQ